MDRRQLVKLYDLVATNWNFQPVSQEEKVKRLETWNRYLHNVDFEKTLTAIDRLAYAGGYAPRPGELRIQVLAGESAPPIPAVALTDAKNLTQAIQTGTQIPQVHRLVAETVAKHGATRDDLFLKIYEEKLRDFLAATYSDGDNMNPPEPPETTATDSDGDNMNQRDN